MRLIILCLAMDGACDRLDLIFFSSLLNLQTPDCTYMSQCLSLFQFSRRSVFPFFCCYAIMRGRENKRKQVRVLNYDLT